MKNRSDLVKVRQGGVIQSVPANRVNFFLRAGYVVVEDEGPAEQPAPVEEVEETPTEEPEEEEPKDKPVHRNRRTK